jgi:non-heme chloroperoxidase
MSEGIRESFWLQGMLAGYAAAYLCIKAFSETDFNDDLKRIDIPLLFIHGDDDQIVPIADAAKLAVKLVRNGRSTFTRGAPHGLVTTPKDRVNEACSRSRKGALQRQFRQHREPIGVAGSKEERRCV